MPQPLDLHFLKMSARLAWRGHGGAEPNPLVGCVIVSPEHEVLGWGYHRKCGEAHAEIIALQRAGQRARGATLYCTMEPCNHMGRTGPCTNAIMEAGIAKVVVARRDPNPVAAGGFAQLQACGIAVEVNEGCAQAIMVSDPFAHRVRSGLPWVIAKWAQTIDGRIATRPPHNESQWISNQASRRMVHRERGRVDAILTGIGTVLKDDPLLTARGVRVRRIARRVVIDPQLKISLNAKLVTTTHLAPTTIVCFETALNSQSDKAKQLRSCGVEMMTLPITGDCLPLALMLRQLSARHDVTNVLVESGPGLMSRLFHQKLVNEAWVFVGPLMLGDHDARSALAGANISRLTDGTRMELCAMQRRESDVIVRYRVIR